MSQIVSARNLIKSYGEGDDKLNVLHKVSVNIKKGEFISIMGPSGSGKSTLMYCLSGMDTVDSGSVTYAGKDILLLKESEKASLVRSKMGFVFQQPTLLKNLNIIDNIILPSLKDNPKKINQLVKKARDLMEKVKISNLEKRDINQTSGGQLQRAGICRALMNNPEIIFGDEPTGSLNSKSSKEIMDILTKINSEGTAILLVTHDPQVALRSQRVLFMIDGEIVQEINYCSGDKTEDRLAKILGEMEKLGI